VKKAEQLKKAQRREARMARRTEEGVRRRQGRRRRQLYLIGGAAVVAVVIALLVLRTASRPQLGEAYPVLAREPHIASVTSPHEPYNSNPPTSGQHVPFTAPWGFHTEVIADEVIVHNLEHGGIWISYKDPNDTEAIEQLRALLPQLPRKTIVTPRPRNDSPIAVVSWGRLMKLERVDSALIIEFANAYRNKAPEPTAQ
jgi:hypothetical protein